MMRLLPGLTTEPADLIELDQPTRTGSSMSLVMGIPDDRRIPVTGVANGDLCYGMIGNSRIATHLPAPVKQRLVRVFFGPGWPARLPAMCDSPVINSIADPDVAAIALRMLAEVVESTGAACFNHPVAVLNSGRDHVAQKLARIPGLRVPRTLRIRAREPMEAIRMAEDQGLKWPLIVRIPSSHLGRNTVKVDKAGQMKWALSGLPWGGRDLYLTEFVEYRDDDERYRKSRFMVIGRQVFQCHVIVSDNWMVHAVDRRQPDAGNETDVVRTFHARSSGPIRNCMLAIAEAMDMDYFGVDCSLRPDGKLLIFEVNAMMDALNRVWDPPLPAGVVEAVQLIEDAVIELLFTPSRWRHPGIGASTTTHGSSSP